MRHLQLITRMIVPAIFLGNLRIGREQTGVEEFGIDALISTGIVDGKRAPRGNLRVVLVDPLRGRPRRKENDRGNEEQVEKEEKKDGKREWCKRERKEKEWGTNRDQRLEWGMSKEDERVQTSRNGEHEVPLHRSMQRKKAWHCDGNCGGISLHLPKQNCRNELQLFP
ncbi:hypothetical protein WN55_02774 [Dufourea novaeangliae]|uniref:Uncharacterized protein n=1 Tax=Dufourea novaeangliae TaxID=178035 RepID=A0A154NXV3_DUFNO|nr:hypothetical protein WN55_02774 [Dufourea novaeangliae]